MARRMLIARVVGVTSTWLLALSAALGSTVLAQVESHLPAASSVPSPPAASPSASAVAAGAWPSTDLADARAITATADRFVAVGGDGTFPGKAAAWTSTDGVTWEPATVADATDGTIMTAVTPTANGLVAVGTATSEGADGPDQVAAWMSADGSTWQRAPVRRSRDGGSSSAVSSVADGPAGILALAEFFGQDAGIGRIYSSTDGSAWDRQRLPGGAGVIWLGVSSIPDGYLVIGRTPQGRSTVFRTDDGQTWQRVRGAPSLLDVATTADGTTAGVTPRRAVVSQDLSSWRSAEVGPAREADADTPPFDWLEWDGTQFGVSGVLYEGCPENVDECYQRWLSTSPDGVTWTESTGPDGLAGPDESMQILDMASVGDTTVVLGGVGASPTLAWIMEG